MNCQKAKEIDLVFYLKKQGFIAMKTTSNQVWFCSPFRDEKTPSFKVDLSKNVFYDFGQGMGGTIIDLVMMMEHCSIKEALEKLSSDTFSFHQQQTKVIKTEKTYSILKVNELTNSNLISYLEKRSINIEFAKRYCFQVHYSFDSNKEYYGIGFLNNSGGFEIRNNFTKLCLGKKALTTINNNYDVVSLFESWSDFLSYLTLKNKIPDENFIILNSTSMVKKVIDLMLTYSEIKIFFDNDNAGDSATDYLIKNCKSKVVDYRIHYKKHKDLNDFLMQREGKSIKPQDNI